MKKYDLSQIMTRAWQLYRKGVAAFAECLHRAWMAAKAAPINAQRIEERRQAFGVTEEVHTWADWHKLGFEVVHGSRCLFQCPLIHASKGDGQTYKASFFGISQVQPLAQQYEAAGFRVSSIHRGETIEARVDLPALWAEMQQKIAASRELLAQTKAAKEGSAAE